MRSLLVEFHRFGKLGTGSLREGDRYLVVAGSHPVRECICPLDHSPFLTLMRALRYEETPDKRAAALKTLGDNVTGMLGISALEEVGVGEFPLQLDVVVNAAELAALPLEAALNRDGRPLLVGAEQAVELTRRVRSDFAERRVRWPARPRILYAWACPPGVGDVPQQAHQDALRAALGPWIPVHEAGGVGSPPGGVLTTLPEVSLAALRSACREAAEATPPKPFTHVHLLAHGYPLRSGLEQHFGMALHADGSRELEVVTPRQLTEALAPLAGHPVVVTLATCDAANMTNSIVPEGSIAHQLHVSGFPVVVASQLPLTVRGSTVLVERFYGALLAGRDVRLALHEARVALYESRDRTGHDWVSLVGYVRLPEGYAEHLLDVQLQAVLASLETAKESSEALVAAGTREEALFDRVSERLRACIARLEQSLGEAARSGRAGVRQENLGLLGSAEKRFAELCFDRDRLGQADRRRPAMRDALQRSIEWYRQGYEANLSHHWTGVQYLSLAAALEGTIRNPAHWHAAVAAAEIDRRKPKEYWAHGSLAELYLLAPVAGQAPSLEEADKVLEEMKGRVRDHAAGDRFPLESTERQLRRYVDWWTTANGFFPGRADLAVEAGRLLAALRRETSS